MRISSAISFARRLSKANILASPKRHSQNLAHLIGCYDTKSQSTSIKEGISMKVRSVVLLCFGRGDFDIRLARSRSRIRIPAHVPDAA